jgi:hypothetical protein
VAALTQGAIARPLSPVFSRNGLLDKYFYFSMSLLVAAIVLWGFSYTVNGNLFHPAIPRPTILYFHAAACSGGVAFFILQSLWSAHETCAGTAPSAGSARRSDRP